MCIRDRSDSDPTPTVSGTAGGTFSSTAGLVIDANTGTIDLGSSSSGTYTVTYSTSNTEQSISTSNLFEDGPNTNWPRAYVSTQITDGAASQNTQTFEINITSLPTGGANYRIAKTVANGNWFNGNAQPLSLGVNTITVASVSFDRSVKIQFSSGDIDFNSIVHNGSAVNLPPELLISSSNLFENGPNTTWPRAYVSTQTTDGAASQNTQTFEINVTSLPAGGANYLSLIHI